MEQTKKETKTNQPKSKLKNKTKWICRILQKTFKIRDKILRTGKTSCT